MKTIRRKLLLLLGGILSLALLSLISLYVRAEKREGLIVGGKGTEGEILGEILAQHIENQLGIPVQRKCQLEGTLIVFEALKSQDIDLYVEYTGTALTAILGESVQGLSRLETYHQVKEGLKKWNIEVVKPLGFENTYALMMDPQQAEALGIKTFSDLQDKELQIRFDQEFCGREEFTLLKEKYHLPLQGLKMMDHVLLYLTMEKKGCDLINGYSTDGFCRGLLLLRDDRGLFPSYEAIPIVRKEALEKYPDLQGVLESLSGTIDEAVMQELNYRVEKNGENVHTVAKTFLESIKSCQI